METPISQRKHTVLNAGQDLSRASRTDLGSHTYKVTYSSRRAWIPACRQLSQNHITTKYAGAMWICLGHEKNMALNCIALHCVAWYTWKHMPLHTTKENILMITYKNSNTYTDRYITCIEWHDILFHYIHYDLDHGLVHYIKVTLHYIHSLPVQYIM